MSASQPHQAVSDRIVRELGDRRQRGRVDLPARLTPLEEAPGFRQEARRSYVLVVAIDVIVPPGLAHADVLVVAPALNSWLRRWLSDEDPARGRAEKRVAALVERLQGTAAHVEGRVGDGDPLQAIADALTIFPADEIVISARPERSTEQVDDLVSRARAFCTPRLLGRRVVLDRGLALTARGIDAARRCLQRTTGHIHSERKP